MVKVSYKKFQKIVWDFYKEKGRAELSWRKTKDPYKIWVSEIMLQQTQVSRVVEKYKNFLEKFPSVKILAGSSQASVLKEWVGLGYNRRALNLLQGSKFVEKEFKGKLPRNVEDLEKIPGIGSYTSRAITTFAFNKRHSFVETNIRTVYFNHFFKDKESVSDKDILDLVEKTLPENSFRDWYYALMDYGAFLKKEGKGKNTKSKHYTKQSKFEGSDRQIRAAIVRYLTQNGETDLGEMLKSLSFDEERVEIQIQKLLDEKMVFLKNGFLGLDE